MWQQCVDCVEDGLQLVTGLGEGVQGVAERGYCSHIGDRCQHAADTVGDGAHLGGGQLLAVVGRPVERHLSANIHVKQLGSCRIYAIF